MAEVGKDHCRMHSKIFHETGGQEYYFVIMYHTLHFLSLLNISRIKYGIHLAPFWKKVCNDKEYSSHKRILQDLWSIFLQGAKGSLPPLVMLNVGKTLGMRLMYSIH